MRLIYLMLWFSAHQVMSVRWNSRHFKKNKIGVMNQLNRNELNSHEYNWITSRAFSQILDHFNPTDFRTWKQRYYENDHYYKFGGPIFLMLDGEASTIPWVEYGNWVILAKEFNAALLQLEHRYYGLSQPTEDTSTKNLKYLSSQQALADAAIFIEHKQRIYGNTSKVIVFGGSYGGTLASWMRLKYPHLVHAAVSSSGPLLVTVDNTQYLDVVKNSLAIYNPECVTQIKLANKMLHSMLRYGSIIENQFKLCSPIDRKNTKDVGLLFESLANNFAEVVQYNPNNIYYPESQEDFINIKYVCDIMLDKSIPSPLDRYARVNEAFLYFNREPCLSTNFTDAISSYLNTEWNESQDGSRQWIYQTCTEFGFFQSSSQSDHTFGRHFPVQYFFDKCIYMFGLDVNVPSAYSFIRRTNFLYGGLNIKKSRVLYVHGSVDPWHVLGVTETNIINAKAITINGTSHCADMYSPLNTDSPELIEAKETIKNHLREWLLEDDYINRK